MEGPPAAAGEDAVATAFGLLGNETRLAILRSLYDAGEPLAFTELRRRTDVADSGKFNYHLEKLVGHFVRGTDDGYELRHAGEQIVRAVMAGVVGREPTLEPVRLDERCPYCGAPVEMRYREERITVACTDCSGVADLPELPDGTFMHYGFPPAAFRGRSLGEVLSAAHTLYDAKLTPMMKGVCPECAGRVVVDMTACADHDPAADGICPACEARHRAWADYACENCGYRRRAIVWFALLAHPAVVAFLHEHGDLEETIPFNKLTWEHADVLEAITEAVVATDPLQVRVTLELDGAAMAVTVDDGVEIVDVVRQQ